MFKLTERVGEIELTYEADTVEGVAALKNAINPPVLYVAKDVDTSSLVAAVDKVMCGEYAKLTAQ